jgi:hypothetical protein
VVCRRAVSYTIAGSLFVRWSLQYLEINSLRPAAPFPKPLARLVLGVEEEVALKDSDFVQGCEAGFYHLPPQAMISVRRKDR